MATTVVQTTYRPILAPGAEGMISDTAPSSVVSRANETAAGIGFGRAVSFGASAQTCKLGSNPFLGFSVRDITLVTQNVDPLDATLNPLDTYGYRVELGVMTRGHIWLKPQDIVVAGEALFYDEVSGLSGNAAAGLQASGWIKFAKQPAANETLVINAATLTFVTGVPTTDQAQIGASLHDTVVNATKAMNDSATAGFAALTFTVDPPQPLGGGGGADTILIQDNTAGALTKAITSGPAGMTKSGGTLTGGSAAATAIAGARWITNGVAGQLAIASLGIQY